MMPISPGRSASQAAPNARPPMATRKMTTRIMGAIASTRRLGERGERIGRKGPARRKGVGTRLRLAHPFLRRRPHGCRQIVELLQRTRQVAAHRLELDTRNDGRRIVTGNFLD